MTGRFVRHFHVICFPNPSEATLRQMFLSVVGGFLSDFPENLQVSSLLLILFSY